MSDEGFSISLKENVALFRELERQRQETDGPSPGGACLAIIGGLKGLSDSKILDAKSQQDLDEGLAESAKIIRESLAETGLDVETMKKALEMIPVVHDAVIGKESDGDE